MGRKSFSYCFFFSCRFPVGTKAEPKRWGRGGRGQRGGYQPGLHRHHSPHPAPTPSAPCPGPHRRPRGEDAVEHVTSESHADHQISGIAEGTAVAGGSRGPRALLTHSGLPPPCRHPDSPDMGPPSPRATPRGKPCPPPVPAPGSAVSFYQHEPWQECPGTCSLPTGRAASPPSTYPTPIR